MLLAGQLEWSGMTARGWAGERCGSVAWSRGRDRSRLRCPSMAAAVAGPPGGEGGVSLSAGFQHLPGRCAAAGRPQVWIHPGTAEGSQRPGGGHGRPATGVTRANSGPPARSRAGETPPCGPAVRADVKPSTMEGQVREDSLNTSVNAYLRPRLWVPQTLHTSRDLLILWRSHRAGHIVGPCGSRLVSRGEQL